jgi:ANTAR domain-containing protein
VRWWRPSWPRCRCWISSQRIYRRVADPDSDSWAELNTLSRAEVRQATGMLVAQVEVEPAEAVVRLRAHAFATGRSATDVACDILDRRLRLQAD